jgi:osmotically-inducible protein OsmY
VAVEVERRAGRVLLQQQESRSTQRGRNMLRKIGFSRPATMIALSAAILVLPQVSLVKAWGSPAPSDDNNKIAQEVKSKLDGKQFQNVQVSIDNNGVADLTGTVDLYQYKADADKKAHKVKGVKAVRNDIEVAGGPSMSDQELQQKIQQKLATDRVGYGTNAFNAITVSVQNGEVTLGGHAYGYPDKNSALAVVSTMPGVKDVNDEIQVDPPSPMDDQIRLQVARAIYGYPSLNKYAINPANPIRISVQNGHVELYGVVDSKADKDTAYIRANGVPGVFSVKNNLQVEGQAPEQDKSQNQQK